MTPTRLVVETHLTALIASYRGGTGSEQIACELALKADLDALYAEKCCTCGHAERAHSAGYCSVCYDRSCDRFTPDDASTLRRIGLQMLAKAHADAPTDIHEPFEENHA